MKAIVMLLAAALCCGSVRAAVPHEINYQGYLTSPGGAPVNTTVSIVFSLYDDPALSGPHQLYTETQSVPVVNGVFNVLIGPQQAAQFALLAFDVPYWLGVTVGSDPEMTPRQPIAAGAYAIRSASTESLAATATVPAAQVTGAVGSATSFTGALSGDVTGVQSATVVGTVGGLSAANVAAGANLANAGTNANTANAIVRRDASGNFAAGTITGNVTGNAGTATKLATALTINGVPFDGTANIALPAAVTIAHGYGPVATSVSLTNNNFVFVGPTVTVTVIGSQTITASATIGLGASAGGKFSFELCYRNTGSSSINGNFFIISQLIPNVVTNLSPTKSLVPGAGTYEVGVCVAGAGGSITLNNNDYGWIWAMVTN